ncbi:hypothetical protein PHLCEN_2v4383 [Hermanssonia centrifuga]|uniref:N-acetyltransferase domain-containing protein n=1 Tax=Hermanssonia centrifuga TaxID=98765 RepID=A0A2R6PVI7_9APHY|nr:hypothetical protein PHLCEN_2v4383 [Hermanssonia centrifuga]
MYDYIPFAPFPTLPAFLDWVETRIRCDPTLVLFAVLDKSKTSAHPESQALAGTIGLLDTSPDHLRTEIGLLFTLPTYWRTHITANAVGLLLSWCFDELGMRRVQWRSDPMNVASIRVAERMGFQRERVKRWDRVLAPGKEGVEVRADDVMPEGKGLHTMYLAICWDDWGEWRERVLEVMNRR